MKKRENSRLIEERKDKKGKLLCLVPTCRNLRQKYKTGKNFRNYCKKHTFEDMWEFTSWNGLREKVFKRDNYACVKCGDKRKEVEVIIKSRRIINWNEFILGKEFKPKYESCERKETRSNFTADHIKPIALGGDEWNKKNIQTLCNKCNKTKTKEDHKNIAKQRRIDKIQDKNKVLKTH